MRGDTLDVAGAVPQDEEPDLAGRPLLVHPAAAG